MLTGNMGRWHGGAPGTAAERHDRNELHRHEEMLAEWLEKRAEANQMISQHRAAIKKLRDKLQLEEPTP